MCMLDRLLTVYWSHDGFIQMVKLDQVEHNKSISDYFLSGTESELAEKALGNVIRIVKKAPRSDELGASSD